MKFIIFILTVFVLYQTRGTTAVRNSNGEQSISSVIRAYGETLDKFYINRTFEFEHHTLQHIVPLSTQLSLKSVANNLLFTRERIGRFCNVTRDTQCIDKNAELLFFSDIGKYLTAMRQSIPLDFIVAEDPKTESAVRITIDVTNNNFVLRSKLTGDWDGPAPKLSSILQNVILSIPSDVVASENYRFSSVSNLQVFQTTTAVFLRHIDDVLSKISFVTENSRGAILEACNETGRFSNILNIDHSTTELQKTFTPCANNAVDQTIGSWCIGNCESCTLTLCKSTLSHLIYIGSNVVEPELTSEYKNFLDSIRGNQNQVCVNIFHTFLLNRRPMMRETFKKMTSEGQQVIFSTTSASPYDVGYQIVSNKQLDNKSIKF